MVGTIHPNLTDKDAVTPDHSMAIFVAELILLLAVGRLLGEAMSRCGQPAIFGQLLAGVVLGPSVFGTLLPDVRVLIFPSTPALKTMIEVVSQIGVLLLLLLTGMETNLALVNRKRRAVISTSLFGIGVPFICGALLAYALPSAVVPASVAPRDRLVPWYGIIDLVRQNRRHGADGGGRHPSRSRAVDPRDSNPG